MDEKNVEAEPHLSWAELVPDDKIPEIRSQPCAFGQIIGSLRKVKKAKYDPENCDVDRHTQKSLNDLKALSGLNFTEKSKNFWGNKEDWPGQKKWYDDKYDKDQDVIAENLKQNHSKGLRKTWQERSKAGTLKSSGLPPFMQSIVDGTSEGYEKDMQNYLQVCGLNYVVSEERLNQAAEDIKELCTKFDEEVTSRIEKLLSDYRNLQPE